MAFSMRKHEGESFLAAFRKIPALELVIVVAMAFLSGAAIQIFMNNPGGGSNFYTGGVTGIAQYAKTLFDNSDLAFNLAYYGLNAPLVIFGMTKIGKKFTILTILYIVLVPVFIGLVKGFNISMFTVGNVEQNLMLIALAGAVIYGFSIAALYKVGASSGGTDFVATYYATSKGKAIGGITTKITYAIIFVGQVLVALVKPEEDKSFIQNVLNIKLLYTLIFVFLVGMTIDRIYPKGKKVSLHCMTFKGKEIVKHFKSINYLHAITIIKTKGSMNVENETLVFGCFLMETDHIVAEIVKVDPKAFCMIHSLVDIKGRFANSKRLKNEMAEELNKAK